MVVFTFIKMPKTPQPTIYDVAHKAGVSIATVSRVLNASSQVRAATRNRVLAAVEELGFIPRAEAVARARSVIGRIGIISPFFTIPSFAQRMRGVATVLANSPYELVIYTVDSLIRYESFLATLPLNQQLDGLIINALPMEDRVAKRLKENALGIVLIENSHPFFSSVTIDDQLGGNLAAAHLLRKGHRKFGFLDFGSLPEYALEPGIERLKGFQLRLKTAGIDLDKHYIKRPPMQDLVETRRQIEELLALPDPPTAIFAAADYLVLSLIRVAQEKGLRIPEDLAIIGFDDIEVADLIGITTISQSLDESGQIAARLLLDLLSNPEKSLQNITLQLDLIERKTG